MASVDGGEHVQFGSPFDRNLVPAAPRRPPLTRTGRRDPLCLAVGESFLAHPLSRILVTMVDWITLPAYVVASQNGRTFIQIGLTSMAANMKKCSEKATAKERVLHHESRPRKREANDDEDHRHRGAQRDRRYSWYKASTSWANLCKTKCLRTFIVGPNSPPDTLKSREASKRQRRTEAARDAAVASFAASTPFSTAAKTRGSRAAAAAVSGGARPCGWPS